jgi:hypothetical protein
MPVIASISQSVVTRVNVMNADVPPSSERDEPTNIREIGQTVASRPRFPVHRSAISEQSRSRLKTRIRFSKPTRSGTTLSPRSQFALNDRNRWTREDRAPRQMVAAKRRHLQTGYGAGESDVAVHFGRNEVAGSMRVSRHTPVLQVFGCRLVHEIQNRSPGRNAGQRS